MADEHPNAALLRNVYGGDLQLLFKNIAPDYEVHIPGKSDVAAHYLGIEGHKKHRKVMQAIAGDTMKLKTLGTFLADDNWGLVPSRVTAQREGKSFDLQGFGLWRFRDGRFTDHWAITGDQVAWDAFFTMKDAPAQISHGYTRSVPTAASPDTKAEEHPNAALLRRLYGGDSDALFKNVSSDYQVHIPGRSDVAGKYPGVEGHLRHREVMQKGAGNTMKLRTLGTFLANDEWGLVPSRVTANNNGKSFDLQGFGLWHFRNGQVTDHWAITDDQVAWDSFFTTK